MLCESGSSDEKFGSANSDILRFHHPDLAVVSFQHQQTFDKPTLVYATADHNSATSHNGTLPGNGSVNLNSSMETNDHIYSNIDTLDKNASVQKSLQRLLDTSHAAKHGASSSASNSHNSCAVSEATGLLSDSKNSSSSEYETRSNSLYSPAATGGASVHNTPAHVTSHDPAMQCRQSVLSCQLPQNVEIEAIAVENVTSAGSRLTLRQSGEY